MQLLLVSDLVTIIIIIHLGLGIVLYASQFSEELEERHLYERFMKSGVQSCPILWFPLNGESCWKP